MCFCSASRPHYFYDAEAVREPEAQYAYTFRQWWGSTYQRPQVRHDSHGGSKPNALGTSAGRRPQRPHRLAHPQRALQRHPLCHLPHRPGAPLPAGGSADAGVQRVWGAVEPGRGAQCLTQHAFPSHGPLRSYRGPHGVVPHDSAGALSPRQQPRRDFAPTCACTAGTQPATVLDPFCGSGTTLLVARELGHHAVGIDLSYPYLHDIARERLGLADLARWEGRHGHGTPAVTYGDLPLFGGQGDA